MWQHGKAYSSQKPFFGAAGHCGGNPRLEHLEGRLLCSTVPNDSNYSSEWGLQAINAAGAWDTVTGSRKVAVADIDTGLDYTHPDLYQNVWINQAEIPSAVRSVLTDTDGDGLISFIDLNASANVGKFGIHDLNKNGYIDAGDLLTRYKADGTGGWEDGINGATWKGETAYVDDIVGWDFANNDNDPFDHDGHGTHTAGVIGATGNNGKGVSGVNWSVSLISLKIFTDRGKAASDPVIATAIRYSANAGAKVSNNSWGGNTGKAGDVIYRAISYAGDKGQVFVAAAGNDQANSDVSRWRSYPASYDLANIISVAAIDRTGRLASYSNYGKTSVDAAAPGNSILSTLPGGKYGTMSGTSMATPFVTGAVALLLSQDASRSVSTLKSLILKGADQSTSLLDTSVSGGVLNVGNALAGKAGNTAQAATNYPDPWRRRDSFWGRGPGGSRRGRWSFSSDAGRVASASASDLGRLFRDTELAFA
ncbi:MAG: S8 family peptidase [Bacillota bacterium]